MMATVRMDRVSSRAQRGFTLIEMMITVVVIAILAAIVVPTFFRESRKTKANSEVIAMFAEMAMKLEQYKVDNGSYISLAECPTVTSPAGTSSASCAAVTSWASARVNPTANILKCKYQVTAGPGTTTAVPPAGFTFASPAASWYWMIATCDGDGSSTVNATFFANSVDPTIQKQNEAN